MNGDLAEGVVPGLLREIYVGRAQRDPDPRARRRAAEPPLPPRAHRQRPHQRRGGAARRDAGAPGAPPGGRSRPRHRDRGARRAAARRGPGRARAARRETASRTRSPSTSTRCWPGSSPGTRAATSSRRSPRPRRAGAHAEALDGRADPRGGAGRPRPGRGPLRAGRHGPGARALLRPPAALPEARPCPRTDGFVLSRVDGTTSAHEIVQMIPLPAEETQKSLFGLLSTGIVEYAAAPGPQGRAGPGRATCAARGRAGAPPPSPRRLRPRRRLPGRRRTRRLLRQPPAASAPPAAEPADEPGRGAGAARSSRPARGSRPAPTSRSSASRAPSARPR